MRIDIKLLIFYGLASGVGIANATILTAISVGPAWYSAGKTQTFYLEPDVVNTYDAVSKTRILASGELFLGIQRVLLQTWFGQLGMALAKSNPATLQGDIWQLADPNFNNFTYQYRVSHEHIAIKSKLLSTHWSQVWLPYLSGSVGVARNKAYSFSDAPKIFEAIPAPSFRANTQTTYTYTLGMGIQRIFSVNWAFGIGYEFADWGSSSLGRAPGQTFNTGLSISHLYTNQLQFNLSYFLV